MLRRVTALRRHFPLSSSLWLSTLVAALAVGCSETPPNNGDMTTGGGPPPGGQPDSSVRSDASIDATDDGGGATTDARSDTSQPPPRDAAVDMRAPNDAAADTARPTDTGSAPDNTVTDANRVDVSVDSSTPPTPDAAPPTDTGGGGMDAPKADTGGPSADAGCDSSLTGVDLFRCQALNYGQAYEHLEDLTTNVGPRLAGTAGFTKAVMWATAKLTAMGLQNVHTEAVTVPHWERGDGHAELIGASGDTPLAIAALGGSVATATSGLEAEVIEVASTSALSALSNTQVQGKIVFMNVVMQRTMDAAGYSAVSGARRNGPSTAGSKGAVGYIVRSLTPAMDNAPHTGDMNNASIPAVAIGVQDALVLSNAVKAGTTRVRITLGCQTLANVQTSNVIGEFVGKQAPSEIVLVGGHLDSWDLGTGAHDDGAGVIMAAEAARLISVYAPDTRRTVRVVLFANEENGLSGANAYANAHSSDDHIMAIEADLGGDRVYGVTFSAASSAQTTIRNLLAALMPLGVAAATTGNSAGADLGPLSGVPKAELQQDLTRYFDFHHAPTDVMGAIDRAQLTQATAAMAVFAYQLARSDVQPGPAPIPAKSDEHEH